MSQKQQVNEDNIESRSIVTRWQKQDRNTITEDGTSKRNIIETIFKAKRVFNCKNSHFTSSNLSLNDKKITVWM